MLRTSKIKDLVSKTHPFMREFISPTKAVLYAFSDCIIKYGKVDYNLKCKEHLILEGKEINILKQPEEIEYVLEGGFVFGFLDDDIFKFEDVENAQDKDILKQIHGKIKNNKPILEAWSRHKNRLSEIGVKSLWGIPKK